LNEVLSKDPGCRQPKSLKKPRPSGRRQGHRPRFLNFPWATLSDERPRQEKKKEKSIDPGATTRTFSRRRPGQCSTFDNLNDLDDRGVHLCCCARSRSRSSDRRPPKVPSRPSAPRKVFKNHGPGPRPDMLRETSRPRAGRVSEVEARKQARNLKVRSRLAYEGQISLGAPKWGR